MFQDDGTGTAEIVQENHFYSFGLQMNGGWNQQTNPEQNYLFTGFERQHDFGLNLDMALFRTFDPASCRWLQIDPMAQEMSAWSPYNYGFNNPVKYVDPDGLNPIIPWALRKMVWEGVKQIGRTIFTPAKPPSQFPGPITVAPPRGATVIDRNITVARDLARQAEMMGGFDVAPEAISSNVTNDTGGLGNEAIVKAEGLISVDPYSLVPKESTSKSQVKKIAEDMQVNGFSNDPALAIEAVELYGKLYILDGHHRAAAAKEAGIDAVVNVISEKEALRIHGYDRASDIIWEAIEFKRNILD